MAKLTLFDSIAAMQAKGETVNLKGHAKFTLRDSLTGKITDEVESDNLITNAVASVLANNYSGMTNFSGSDIAPLKKLFNGVLLFKDALTESADNYNVPSETGNICYACAGDEMHSTANPYRGNPNAAASDSGADYEKFVWDWAPEQGNGTISACCLVPGILGNMGTKPFDNTQNVLRDLTIAGHRHDATPSSFNSTNYIKNPIIINSDGISGIAVWADGTTFTESTVLHNYHKLSILRDPEEWEVDTTRTATIRTVTDNKVFIFFDSDYYYVAHITGAAAIQIDKISRTDMTVTTMDISGLSDVSLYQGVMLGYGQNKCSVTFPFDGTYLYLPNSDNSAGYAINLATPADVVALTGVANCFNEQINGWRDAHFSPVVISEGLIWMGTRLINGNTVYPLAQPPHPNGSTAEQVWYSAVRRGASLYAAPRKFIYDGSFGQATCLLAMFLSSINNLPSSVPKTNSRYMRLEYTLTQI